MVNAKAPPVAVSMVGAFLRVEGDVMARSKLLQRHCKQRWRERLSADPVRLKRWRDYHSRYLRLFVRPWRPLPFVPTALPLPPQPYEEE